MFPELSIALVAILLAIASNPGGLILVDEMENGVYYKHFRAMWKTIINFAHIYDCQIFSTTHNEEWLEALAETAEEHIESVAFWRIERAERQPVVRQFSGKVFKAGIETGGELRG